MMKQMGMKMNELNDINTVILRGPKREIVIEGPSVTSIDMKGQKMYQIAGGKETERAPEGVEEEPLEIPEEDILLVAQQTGVDMEKARAALEQTEGDLAKAILSLKTG